MSASIECEAVDFCCPPGGQHLTDESTGADRSRNTTVNPCTSRNLLASGYYGMNYLAGNSSLRMEYHSVFVFFPDLLDCFFHD